MASAGALGAVASLGLDQLATDNSPAFDAVTMTRVLMGTVVNLTVIDADRSAAQKSVHNTLRRMAELETIFSRHQATSQLTQLNRAGHLHNPASPLVDVLQLAQLVSERTNGAFDVTVKPLLDLYAAAQQTGGIPSAADVQAILPLIGYQNMHIDSEYIVFAQPNMGITLDGIAKGYIIDAGVETLQTHGYKNVLIEAGGDLFAAGQKSAEKGWTIGIQAPRSALRQFATQIDVRGQAVASSGDYMQSFTSDFSQHHILDPRTGFSAPELASVTVTAPSAALADALATALMVMGSPGLMLIEQWPQCAAYVIDKQLTARQTSNFPVSG